MLNFQYFDDTDEDPNYEPDHEQTEANDESKVRDYTIIEDEFEDTDLTLHCGAANDESEVRDDTIIEDELKNTDLTLH